MGQVQPNPQPNSCCNLLNILHSRCKLKDKNCLQEDLELYEIDINQLLISHKRVYSDQKPNRRESRSSNDSRSDEKQISFSLNSQSQELNDDSLILLRQHSCKRRLYVENGKYVLQDSLQTNAQTARSHQNQNKQNAISGLNLPSNISYGLFNSQNGFSKRIKQSNSYLTDNEDYFLSTPKQQHIYNSPGTEKWRDFLDNFNLKQKSIRLAKQPSKQLQKSSQYINYQNEKIIPNYSQIQLNQIKSRRYTNGDMIIGRFLEGIPEGEVKYLKNDGSFFQGQFIAGKATGHGIYRGSKGFYYQGYWLNNQPSGFGKAVYQNKITYQGSFLFGKKHGKGILKQPGYRYQGFFKNDSYDGDGQLFINGFLTYKGEWKDNLMDGFGQYFQTSQQRYEGEFKKGKKYGYGVMTYSNGDVYEGYWKDDIRSGFGTLKTKQKMVSGSWVRNRLIEQSQTTVTSD